MLVLTGTSTPRPLRSTCGLVFRCSREITRLVTWAELTSFFSVSMFGSDGTLPCGGTSTSTFAVAR